MFAGANGWGISLLGEEGARGEHISLQKNNNANEREREGFSDPMSPVMDHDLEIHSNIVGGNVKRKKKKKIKTPSLNQHEQGSVPSLQGTAKGEREITTCCASPPGQPVVKFN